jgi:hypothetical protein
MKKIDFLFLSVVLLLVLYANCSCNPHKNQSATATDIDTLKPSIKPTVNFYIENSGSMDGYVKGVTEFEQAIYSYLSDIKISGITDSLNLLYINSKPISVAENADLDVISDFIEKLEPASFKQKGGDRGNTDIADVIKRVLTDVEPNSISILVSDYIFSPGYNEKNPKAYMLNQQIGIKNTMATKFKIANPAFVVYQLHSKFDGQFYYFDTIKKHELGKYYNGVRPFYIWIIGDVKNVAELCQKVPESKFRGQDSIKVFSVMAGTKTVNYAVKPHSGDFDLSRKNTKTDIDNLKKDSRTGKVKFSVNVDFSNLLLDDAYLTNADNYELNNKEYTISVKISPPNEHGYTHFLSFTADRVYKGVVSVKLKKQKPLPQWIDDANDDDGSQPGLEKTYGIKYLIEGVFEGFTLKDQYYTEIKININ